MILQILTGKLPANSLQQVQGSEEEDLAAWVRSKMEAGDVRLSDTLDKEMKVTAGSENEIAKLLRTDPNWSYFLYDGERKTINLIDFRAARDYPKRFVDVYLRVVVACASKDRDAIIEMSQRLGFLTGTEPDVMLDAHVQAGFIVGLPFAEPGDFDFCKNNLTRSVSNLGATMLRHRLTPPPDEVYSLHGKLSGAFLACIKLGAVVPCREVLLRIYKQYRFDEEDNSRILSKESGF